MQGSLCAKHRAGGRAQSEGLESWAVTKWVIRVVIWEPREQRRGGLPQIRGPGEASGRQGQLSWDFKNRLKLASRREGGRGCRVESVVPFEGLHEIQCGWILEG